MKKTSIPRIRKRLLNSKAIRSLPPSLSSRSHNHSYKCKVFTQSLNHSVDPRLQNQPLLIANQTSIALTSCENKSHSAKGSKCPTPGKKCSAGGKITILQITNTSTHNRLVDKPESEESSMVCMVSVPSCTDSGNFKDCVLAIVSHPTRFLIDLWAKGVHSE